MSPNPFVTVITLDRRQSKTLILSPNIDQNSLETEFLIARQIAIKTTVSSDFDPRSSIVKSVLECPLSGMVMEPIAYIDQTLFSFLYPLFSLENKSILSICPSLCLCICACVPL